MLCVVWGVLRAVCCLLCVGVMCYVLCVDRCILHVVVCCLVFVVCCVLFVVCY